MTKQTKFKTGDKVVIYDSLGVAIYNAEIKHIDEDGYSRLVTDAGLALSKILTNETKDVKIN
jgi:hypothetical protein